MGDKNKKIDIGKIIIILTTIIVLALGGFIFTQRKFLFTTPSKAYESGKSQGLSADDTSVEDMLINELKLEKIEVMAASVNITNRMEIGNDYSALYALKGSAVFTVDLSEMVIDPKTSHVDNRLEVDVIIPKPESEIIINDLETEKLKEKQEYHWFKFNEDGNAEDGYQTFINSMDKMENAMEDNIDNYDELYSRAEDSAKKQVETFINSIVLAKTGEEVEVNVEIAT